MGPLNTTKKLLNTETKSLSSIRTEPRTQEIENDDPRAAFSQILFLSRPNQSSHLRT